MNANRKLLTAMLALIVALVTAAAAEAGTYYYVDGANSIANDANPGTEALPWQTISKANKTLVSGDTVYIKGGTYTSYIAPQNSGGKSAPIVYRNFGTDVVTIQNAAYGIWLNGKSYITVQGINFYSLDQFLIIENGSNYNTIAFCKFDKGRSNQWTGSAIRTSSSYNWIHDCSFSNYGACLAGNGAGSDSGTVIDIGNEESGTDVSSYNLIENSAFFHGGHHVMGVFSKYNTIRNNYFHNEAWTNDRGERNLYLQGYATNSGYVLIEGNRFGYSTRTCNNAIPTVGSVAMSTSNNIFRYNKIYYSVAYGIGTYSYGSPYNTGSYNKIYNNTIFNSGYNIDPSYAGGTEDSAIWFGATVNTGNQVKNNLYFKNYQVQSGNTTKQAFANNWNGDKQGDPLFVNGAMPADKTDASLPNLDLQSGSPAIDKGGALTTVASASGGGATLGLADASYFQDGTFAPPGIVNPDWIAVGTPDNIVQIISISGNTLTLAGTIKWTTGDPVWLYRKSDGVRVLYGTAPDAGAVEFPQGVPEKKPSPPIDFKVF